MIYLTLFIFVKEGKEHVFYEFEDLALPLLADYNGKLMYRIRPQKDAFITAEATIPHEIHFLSFDSEEDFSNFAKDKRRTSFLHLKKESIQSSFLVKGQKL